MSLPVLVFTQGCPAGIGPEILLRAVDPRRGERRFRPVLVAEGAALDALRPVLADYPWHALRVVAPGDAARALDLPAGEVAVVDPVGQERRVTPGRPGPDDARGALAALDLGVDLVSRPDSPGDALVTAPLSKSEIARHLLPGFRGHTDYLAERAGLERYGRDYLMAFLAPGLRVALLSTHVPLRRALELVTEANLLDALRCLARHGGPGPIAVAAVDPHAGEGGLLGTADDAVVRPAVAAARAEGLDVHGPESADSLFARALDGEFRWVLALYHDQGLIAVKTAAFGRATNWTLGLPYLRTSVDHGTAYPIAGRGIARVDSLEAVVATTIALLERQP